MTHIVEIDRARTLRALSASPVENDPFDVVVFLNHFLTNDGYTDSLSADPKVCLPQTNEPSPVHQLVMQSGNLRLCVSLGAEFA